MITTFSCEYCQQTLPIQEPSKLNCSSCGKPSWPAEVKAIASSGNKIWAIKVYRMATNYGLKEAKDAVEQYLATKELSIPEQFIATDTQTPPTQNSQEQEFFQLCQTSPINAIKIYREKTGLGLKESKDAIDAIRAGARQLPAGFFGAPKEEPSPLGQLVEILRKGNKIEAIKLYREKTGLGLKEAKDAIEAYMANSSAPLASPFGAGETATTPAAPTPQHEDVRQRVATLLAEGNYIEAIKFYREKTGLGLKEAKDAVDAARAGQPLPLNFIAAPIEQPTYHGRDPEQELLSLIQSHNLIGAIKLYREQTGLGLADSKAAVEAIARGEKKPPLFSLTPTPAPKPASDPNAAFRQELLATLKSDGVISAIQQYRAKTGVSLKEGKDFIDALEENPNAPFPLVQ